MPATIDPQLSHLSISTVPENALHPQMTIDLTNTNNVTSSSKKKSYPSILDHTAFDPDIVRRIPTIGFSAIMQRARQRLLLLLKHRDYRSSLTLLAALVETCKYSPLMYWNVGEDIIRHCQPEELTTFLKRTMVGIRYPKNIESLKEYIIHLLDDEGFIPVQEQLGSDTQLYGNDPMAIKLFAMILYDEWKQQKTDQLLIEAKNQLTAAYNLNPMDRYIIKAYLEVLTEIQTCDNKEDKQICELKIQQIVTDTAEKVVGDPELLCTLLHYAPAVNLGIRLCEEDPVADPTISFLPTIGYLTSGNVKDPKYSIQTMCRTKLITDRLEYGAIDSPTLDELEKLLSDIDSMSDKIRTDVITYINSIELSVTLEDLKYEVPQGATKTRLALLKMKIKNLITMEERNRYNSSKRKIASFYSN
ncbi:uncharacterized protein BX664DRAFT_321264 [Halteromyces radiatus]|uniref:uncharacterized protein n=1 Tax=Halteromyces radiatus TaxID=101107 RepID=UPI00221EF6E1|nr:uncharacterized protein BX664DRAFT_321264 [Halteromyces radiatus]KAI8099445.1 hypothetical protein BX664DRAFT_321264 [Halteromyces radiatus]